MPKYLYEASFTVEGVKGLQREGGTGRREAVTKAAESVGGHLESMYFALGERDVFVIVDLPDNESAVALSLAVNATGAVQTRGVALLTPEEVDRATGKSPEYRAPGA